MYSSEIICHEVQPYVVLYAIPFNLKIGFKRTAQFSFKPGKALKKTYDTDVYFWISDNVQNSNI
jgi:hypothetical protein